MTCLGQSHYTLVHYIIKATYFSIKELNPTIAYKIVRTLIDNMVGLSTIHQLHDINPNNLTVINANVMIFNAFNILFKSITLIPFIPF